MDYITAPLDTPEKGKAYLDEQGYVSATVSVDLADLIDNDLEGVLDILSEKLVGNDLLMDIDYRVGGTGPGNPGAVLLKVSGDPSMAWGLDGDEEDD